MILHIPKKIFDFPSIFPYSYDKVFDKHLNSFVIAFPMGGKNA